MLGKAGIPAAESEGLCAIPFGIRHFCKVANADALPQAIRDIAFC